ncbi:RNA 2'-phosphotransferase [Brachyspira hyodysenteriae]|uniref:RNA 2'-phosphotransferase n=1 Tax=Brachyspira hyodysenteriae TaxID=159 RepID=UPI0022CD3115|nr:RNA 2'-phosphotransferase [Brachyspira hyodysenteriae]MCZ9847010.1 RNA 2'-phosphotransferase [Brachyspira hyodysenteriae]MCZ9850816.1 RNA 2'-phosphotransferase [Brachyspira hyodysenteriae]MCZ9860431.1 RNA 2'-phosphotransferase [Brachyspira hyodysenteriae]MCZ9869287.1 RNA 2'-phosphotransferase [Brachyspira hyodysenteriae]
MKDDKLTKEEIKISKFVSLVLRHKPEYIGLELSKDGWANVYELIEKIKSKGRNINKDILERVVLYNDKKRFRFNENHTLIRANQGHSINVDLQFEEKEPPEILFHGTSISSIERIKQEGIKKMNRLHVHLSLAEETAKKVGERHGKPTTIKINSKQMYEDGIKFYLSENKVWLCDYVDPKYIIEVI